MCFSSACKKLIFMHFLERAFAHCSQGEWLQAGGNYTPDCLVMLTMLAPPEPVITGQRQSISLTELNQGIQAQSFLCLLKLHKIKKNFETGFGASKQMDEAYTPLEKAAAIAACASKSTYREKESVRAVIQKKNWQENITFSVPHFC